GPGDLVDNNKSGILIDRVGDIEGLTSALLRLIESEDLRREMGENGYEKSKQFSQDIVMGKWMSLFEELIKNNDTSNDK
ncbi:MAG: hypothetical protein SNH13_07870, partial [Rikenellaceae bacterium]